MRPKRSRSKLRTILLGAGLLALGAVFGVLAAGAWGGEERPDEGPTAAAGLGEDLSLEPSPDAADAAGDPGEPGDRERLSVHDAPGLDAPTEDENAGIPGTYVDTEPRETASESTIRATDDSGGREPSPPVDVDPAEAAEVDRILARAEAVYTGLASLRARFDQEVHVPLLDRRRQGTGIWYQKGKNRFKMDFEEPPEDVIVADGVHLWLYYPSTNPRQVIRQSLDAPHTSAGTADVLGRILEEARTSYVGSYGGRETVSGVATHRIDLRPVDRSPYRSVRVWIGAEDHLVRQFEIVEENETIRTVTLRDLEPNAPIPDEMFRFRPPPDADVFAG